MPLSFNKLILNTWPTNPSDFMSQFQCSLLWNTIYIVHRQKMNTDCENKLAFVIQSNEHFLFPLSSLLIRQSRSLLLYVSYLWKQNLLSVSLSLSEQWNVWEICLAFFILADKSASDCSADPPWNHHLLPSNSFWQKCWQNIQSRWQFCTFAISNHVWGNILDQIKDNYNLPT